MISGAARLTAHGSAAAAVVGTTTGGGGGNDCGTGAVAGNGEVTVGSGVLDAVESPEPHAATVTVAATKRTAHLTRGQPTANTTGRRTGARRGIAPSTTRLPAR